jgi:hypothetical protein
MSVDEAQFQIRRAFVNGGPGAIVSSLVWLMTAYFLKVADPETAFHALFIGGMFIFPVGALICKYGFGRSASVKGNPLGLLALESTIAMIGCLITAWLLLQTQPRLVFPVAAIAVGTHYLAFKTAYGDRTFWLLGTTLTGVGAAGIFWLPGQNQAIVLAVAIIELLFGVWLSVQGAAGRNRAIAT